MWLVQQPNKMVAVHHLSLFINRAYELQYTKIVTFQVTNPRYN